MEEDCYNMESGKDYAVYEMNVSGNKCVRTTIGEVDHIAHIYS